MAERALKATLTEKRDGVGIITLNRPEKAAGLFTG